MGSGAQITNNADVAWSSIEEPVEDKDLITQDGPLAALHTHKHS